MKNIGRFFFLLLLGPAVTPAAEPAVSAAPSTEKPAVAAKTAPASPFAVRFKQVQDRITVLFAHRNETPPPPDPRHNPFRMPGSTQAAPLRPGDGEAGARLTGGADNSDPSAGPGENLAVLQQAAATLKVTGVVEIAGTAHLVINGRPYKVGDVVKTQIRGETAYLRVKEIEKRSVTLSLDEAEMTLKF